MREANRDIIKEMKERGETQVKGSSGMPGS